VDVKYDPAQTKLVCNFGDGTTKLIDPFELRIKCLCAACVDEFTGMKLIQ